jgi:ribonuclease R
MSAFPSDEALLQFIKDNPGQSGKREVSRAFGIKGADRITLKQRLKTLKERGLVASEGKHFRAAGSLPDVFPALVVSVDDHGDLVVMPRLHVEDGEPQRFIMRVVVASRAWGLPALRPVWAMRCWCAWFMRAMTARPASA